MGNKRSPERQQLYTDIVTTAVEGGINYWARVCDYEYSDTFFGDSTNDASATVIEYGDSETEVARYKLTTATVAKAFGIMRKGPVEYLGEAMRKHYLKEYQFPENADFDANDADNIVQIGLFGKVVYG